jgi:hypothetical protein
MRTYLILKEKASRWNADREIQAILKEINSGPMNGQTAPMTTRNQTATAVVTENSSKGLNGAARDGHRFDFRGALDTAIRQLFARKQFTHRQQISCDLVEFDV